jgi:hypothetical protein
MRILEAMAPRWPKPVAFGAKSASDSMTTVAAPLLAGFSITLAAGALTDPDRFRWPGAAILAAVLAAALLVAAVQLGAWARQWVVSPADFEEWFGPTVVDEDDPAYFVGEMTRANRIYEIHGTRTRVTYNVGIAMLFAALGIAVAPRGGSAQAVARWAAAAIAWAAATAEIGWALLPSLRARDTTHGPRITRAVTKAIQKVDAWLDPQP